MDHPPEPLIPAKAGTHDTAFDGWKAGARTGPTMGPRFRGDERDLVGMSETESPMFRKTYQATHPDMIAGASNDALRERHLIEDLFRPGEISLNYLHNERF